MLDDFYKDGDDPTLPCLDLAGGAPIVDWDDAGSWNAADAVEAIETSAPTGSADVRSTTSRRASGPVIAAARSTAPRTSWREGIFAQEIVAECRERGLLADAVCVTQHPAVTFVRRLTRDLREHRKPPLVLVRRGLHLARLQRKVVARAVAWAAGWSVPETAYDEIRRLA